MAVFPQGYIWPAAGAGVGKAQAAPVAISLTAAYVASEFTFEVHEQNRLFCVATLPGAGIEDPGLLVRVDVSFDGGTTWSNGFKIVAVPGLTVGENRFWIDLPSNWHAATWRIACRDMQADADTTLYVYAESMVRGEGHVVQAFEDQPIELETAIADGIAAWHNGGAPPAAEPLTLALTDEPADLWIPVGPATELEVWAVFTGGPTTSAEIVVEESLDGATTHATIPVINTVEDGLANIWPGQIQFQSAAGALADGRYVSHRVPVQPGSWVRLQAQRTGAAANLLAHIRLFRV